MAQKMRINKETGFLESPSKGSALKTIFNSDLKLKFLEIARDQVTITRKLPDISAICARLNINFDVFTDHRDSDPEFANEWEKVLKEAMEVYSSKLADKAESKNGVIANLAILKWLEKRRWNDDRLIAIYDNRDRKRVLEAELLPENNEITAQSRPQIGNSTDNQQHT